MDLDDRWTWLPCGWRRRQGKPVPLSFHLRRSRLPGLRLQTRVRHLQMILQGEKESSQLTNNNCRGSSAPVPPGSLGWCSTKRDINGIHVNGPSGSPWVTLLAFHHAIYSSMVSDHWSPMASVLLESSLLTFTFSFWIKKQRTTFTFTTGNTSLSLLTYIFI